MAAITAKIASLGITAHPNYKITYALSKEYMFCVTKQKAPNKFITETVKPPKLIWSRYPEHYSPKNTIHIDDLASNFQLNIGNGLKIKPFKEALNNRNDDKELFYLTKYLLIIAAEEPDFTNLDHKKWKEYIISKLWESQTEYKQIPPPPADVSLSPLLPKIKDPKKGKTMRRKSNQPPIAKPLSEGGEDTPGIHPEIKTAENEHQSKQTSQTIVPTTENDLANHEQTNGPLKEDKNVTITQDASAQDNQHSEPKPNTDQNKPENKNLPFVENKENSLISQIVDSKDPANVSATHNSEKDLNKELNHQYPSSDAPSLPLNNAANNVISSVPGIQPVNNIQGDHSTQTDVQHPAIPSPATALVQAVDDFISDLSNNAEKR